MPITDKLLSSRTKNLGIITLNNPQALHALTQDMIEGFEEIFTEWGIHRNSHNPSLTSTTRPLQAILLKSTPAKRPAFCAGGDVKSVYQAGLDNRNPEYFFYKEYQVNHAIATCPIAIVSLWDGVVMGGGAGISVHGKYRVATERTLFAMPECAIGLFPDVGSMWWMTRLLHPSIANYLALTGQRIHASDLLYTGLATHYVPSNQLENLESALVDATADVESNTGDTDIVAEVLGTFHEELPITDGYLWTHKRLIEATFGAESVEGIAEKLQLEGSDFAQSTLQTMQKLSPTSLKLTLEGLKRGANCTSIGQNLQMEYRMARACVRPGADFYEGIRAMLIDKDHAPKWKPATLESVTVKDINQYFTPLPIEKEWIVPDAASKL